MPGRLARDDEFKVRDEFLGVPVALVAALREHLEDDVVASARQVGPACDRSDRLLVQVLEHGEEQRLALERNGASDHVVEGDAERIDVASHVKRPDGLRLFGRHVVGCAEGDAVLGDGVVAEFACEAEVGELCGAVFAHEDVAGLDVAVHESCVVAVAERERDLMHDLEGFRLRHGAVDGKCGIDGLALDEFHDEVVISAGKANVDRPDDVVGLDF